MQHLNQYNITADIAINSTCEGHHYKNTPYTCDCRHTGCKKFSYSGSPRL